MQKDLEIPPEDANRATVEDEIILAAKNLQKLANLLELKVEDGKLVARDGGVLDDASRANIISSYKQQWQNFGLAEEAISFSIADKDEQIPILGAAGPRQDCEIVITINPKHPSFETFKNNIFANEVNKAAEYFAAVMEKLPPAYARQLVGNIAMQQQMNATGVNPAAAVETPSVSSPEVD